MLRGSRSAGSHLSGTSVDPDRLRLEVVVQRFPSELSPVARNARHLVAAERDCRVEDPVRVDPKQADVEPLREPKRSPDVTGPDPGRQAVPHSVGEGGNLVSIGPAD